MERNVLCSFLRMMTLEKSIMLTSALCAAGGWIDEGTPYNLGQTTGGAE